MFAKMMRFSTIPSFHLPCDCDYLPHTGYRVPVPVYVKEERKEKEKEKGEP